MLGIRYPPFFSLSVMPTKYTKKQKDDAAQMLVEGHSIASVSRALSIPRRTLCDWVKAIDKDAQLDIRIQAMLHQPTNDTYRQVDRLLQAQKNRNYVKMQQARLAFEKQKWEDAKSAGYLDPETMAQKVRDGAH